MKYLFRADGGHPIGTGHIYRVNRIASKLKQLGHDVCLVTSDSVGSRKILCDAVFEVIWLPAIDYSNKTKPGFLSDSLTTHINVRDYDAVIIDMLDTDIDQIQTIAGYNRPICTFDDRGSGRILATALINVLLEEQDRQALYPSSKLFEGGKFVTLSNEFEDDNCIKSNLSPLPSSVFIVMGGADASGLSIKCVESLKLLPGIQNVEVVAGASFVHRTQLELALRSAKFEWKVLDFLPTLLPAYMRNDICLVAGGLAMYEVCRVGIPSVAIPQSIDHQNELSTRLQKEGAMLTVGWGDEATVHEIADQVRLLITDTLRCRKMSDAGKMLVDGRGAQRIAGILQDLTA